MERRAILAAGGATATALAANVIGGPGWLRKAFERGLATSASDISQETPAPASAAGLRKAPGEASASPSPDGVPCTLEPEDKKAPEKREPQQSASEILAEARARAVAEKKKILVLVIPDKEITASERSRGLSFGEYLNHGTDADLAPLASAVVVCVRMNDLKEAFGSAPGGDPLMVVVNVASASPTLVPLSAPLSPMPPWGGRGKRVDAGAEERVIDGHITTLAGLIRRGLGEPHASEVEAQAAQVRQEIVKSRPPGGQWAKGSGCGVSYEEGPELRRGGGSCGMGHIPWRSSRFLHFLSNKVG
jgi:hypothetical protein